MINKVTAILLYVADTTVSEKFYASLGATTKREDDGVVIVKFGDFGIDLIDQAQAEFVIKGLDEGRGDGMFLYFQVDDVDAAHKKVLELGYTPSSEPKDWPWGKREFVLRDPDGYKLVLYKDIKSHE